MVGATCSVGVGDMGTFGSPPVPGQEGRCPGANGSSDAKSMASKCDWGQERTRRSSYAAIATMCEGRCTGASGSSDAKSMASKCDWGQERTRRSSYAAIATMCATCPCSHARCWSLVSGAWPSFGPP